MKTINIKDYLSTDKFKSRVQLSLETGMSDRWIRNRISELKETEVVLYNSQTSGYRLAKRIEDMNPQELEIEIELVQHCINDIEARKGVFNQQERTYIAYLKIAERKRNK